jgi:hypothetical protein
MDPALNRINSLKLYIFASKSLANKKSPLEIYYMGTFGIADNIQ